MHSFCILLFLLETNSVSNRREPTQPSQLFHVHLILARLHTYHKSTTHTVKRASRIQRRPGQPVGPCLKSLNALTLQWTVPCHGWQPHLGSKEAIFLNLLCFSLGLPHFDLVGKIRNVPLFLNTQRIHDRQCPVFIHTAHTHADTRTAYTNLG